MKPDVMCVECDSKSRWDRLRKPDVRWPWALCETCGKITVHVPLGEAI